MTRINLIPVSELTDQHLLSEHREIKRIPNVIKSGRYSLDGMPEKYTLGKGHVKFFYDKIQFLYERYTALNCECYKRGFNVENYGISFVNIFYGYYGQFRNNYTPTQEAIQISRDRINEKIKAKPGFYRMYGKLI